MFLNDTEKNIKNKIRNGGGFLLHKHKKRSRKHLNIKQRAIIDDIMSDGSPNNSPKKIKKSNSLFNIKPLITIKPFPKIFSRLKEKYPEEFLSNVDESVLNLFYKFDDYHQQDMMLIDKKINLKNDNYIIFIFWLLFFCYTYYNQN